MSNVIKSSCIIKNDIEPVAGADLGGGGALRAEAPPPSYFDLALGHHEPAPSICFKSRLILIYSLHALNQTQMMSLTILTS